MERRIDTYKALVPDIKWVANPVKAQDVIKARRAAKTAKVEEEREAAKKPMTSWLAGQKLPPVRTIPFRKTKTEAARLAQMGAVLSGFLPPCDSLCITFKDAQEHFALSAKDLESIPGCNRKRKKGMAVSRRIYALEDVHAVAWRLHRDEAGLKVARVAWRQAKGIQQAEAVLRRERQAELAEQRKKKLLALLPEHPLEDPKKRLFGFYDLEAWVLDEASATYIGSAASLQAALDIYKRHFFLASECVTFHANLNALKMDVKYHKKEQRNNAQNQPGLVQQPHCTGLTQPELRAVAEKNALWELGCQLGFNAAALEPCFAAVTVTEQVHATALQRVLDMPNLPNILKKQIPRYMSEPIAQRVKESREISAIRSRCRSQNRRADTLHSEG